MKVKQSTLAIIQSNYVPWKGYFDVIKTVDNFVLLDEVQYTRADWRNRNRIKTSAGLKWLTIPVKTKGRYFQKISETRVCSGSWAKVHLRQLVENYKKARCFDENWDWLRGLYERSADFEYLSEINRFFLTELNKILGIKTRILSSAEFELCQGKTKRLIEICRQNAASVYYTGPGTRAYMETQLFGEAGIELRWIKYPDYPEYEQLYPPFVHEVSILDLILNCGNKAAAMLQGVDYRRTNEFSE